MATCKYCGAEIKWAQQRNGRWIPLNPDGTTHDPSNGSCKPPPSRSIYHYGKWPIAFCGQWAGWFRGNLKVTEKKEEITCKKCLKKMKKDASATSEKIYGKTLPKHMILIMLGRTYYGWDTKSCPFCDIAWKDPKTWSQHMESEHKEEPIYKKFHQIWSEAKKRDYNSIIELTEYLNNSMEEK